LVDKIPKKCYIYYCAYTTFGGEMNKLSDIVLSWVATVLSTAAMFSLSGEIAFRLLMSWNLAHADLRVDAPRQVAIIVGLIVTIGFMSIMSEAQEDYVFNED